MAFVFKNRNTKFWLAGFRDISGKRCNRSTKLLAIEKNKREAERIADIYEEAANRQQTSQQVRRTISEIHKKLTGNELESVTLKICIESWLESKKTSVATSTISFYSGATKKFLDYLGTGGQSDISDITRLNIELFRDELAAKLSPKTVNHHVKVLRMLFRDARDRNLLVDDPTEFVKTVKSKKVLERKPFTIDQVKRILKHCDEEWQSIVLFGLYTGQRLGDIARLKWDLIDLDKGVLRLRTSKTGKLLNLPLHPDLWSHLKSVPVPISKSYPIHPEAARIMAEQRRSSYLSNCFTKILVSAGFREKRSHKALGEGRSARRKLDPLSFHSLRMTATTFLHEAGVSQSVAMAIIGHDSEAVHAIYVNVGELAMREASKKLPSVIS